MVGTIEKGSPAASVLRERRRDRRRRRQARSRATATARSSDQVGKAIGAHKGTPVAITVVRDGREQVVTGATFLDNKQDPPRYRFGFGYDQEASAVPAGPIRASGLAVDRDVDR